MIHPIFGESRTGSSLNVDPSEELLYWEMVATKCFLVANHLESTSICYLKGYIHIDRKLAVWMMCFVTVFGMIMNEALSVKAVEIWLFSFGLLLHRTNSNFEMQYMFFLVNCLYLHAFEDILDIYLIICEVRTLISYINFKTIFPVVLTVVLIVFMGIKYSFGLIFMHAIIGLIPDSERQGLLTYLFIDVLVFLYHNK